MHLRGEQSAAGDAAAVSPVVLIRTLREQIPADVIADAGLEARDRCIPRLRAERPGQIAEGEPIDPARDKHAGGNFVTPFGERACGIERARERRYLPAVPDQLAA